MREAARPLVSVCIPNRDHSAFLRQSIDSVLAQTYPNIEVLVLDNCSDDESLALASAYVPCGVTVCRNPLNIQSHTYQVLAGLARGEYLMMLGADDVILPELVERSLAVLEAHPNVGLVHVERDFIDEEGRRTELDPFFDRSFTCPGDAMLPIYQMSSVAHSAQGVIRRSAFDCVLGHDTEFDHLNIDVELWFRLGMVSDYAYLRETLSHVRLHASSDTSWGARHFIAPPDWYLMLQGFVEWGRIRGYDEVVARESAARRKTARDFLSYPLGALKDGDVRLARQYLLFCRLLHKEIAGDPRYALLEEGCTATPERREALVAELVKTDLTHAARKRGYPPPEGSTPLVMPVGGGR